MARQKRPRVAMPISLSLPVRCEVPLYLVAAHISPRTCRTLVGNNASMREDTQPRSACHGKEECCVSQRGGKGAGVGLGWAGGLAWIRYPQVCCSSAAAAATARRRSWRDIKAARRAHSPWKCHKPVRTHTQAHTNAARVVTYRHVHIACGEASQLRTDRRRTHTTHHPLV